MDIPFQVSEWLPTAIQSAHAARTDSHTFAAKVKNLTSMTGELKIYPYDPETWLNRALTLEDLGYPELALGDAIKARFLCEGLRKQLSEGLSGRLGHRMGFFMVDPDPLARLRSQVERDRQFGLLHQHEEVIYELGGRSLYFSPRPYPWLSSKHRGRSDSIIHALNAEFRSSGNKRSSCHCIVKRNAIVDSGHSLADSESLGVFSSQPIQKHQMILRDKAALWGAKFGVQGRYPSGRRADSACALLVANLQHRSPATRANIDWAHESARTLSPSAILRAEFLERCHLGGFTNPLDHPLAARLTACYPKNECREISLDGSLRTWNETLQRIGVDIFAAQTYDSWVLYTVDARIDNNSWSNQGLAGLNSLFSIFNHSCEPNIDWTLEKDRKTIRLIANRDVGKGEQLFVIYDGSLTHANLATRRESLWRWLNGPCQCTRCQREEADAGNKSGNGLQVSGESSSWDTDTHPTLPEDERDSWFK